jgi:hypothetical protein
MAICQAHNLVTPLPTSKPFGIRVTFKSSDPFRNLIGKDWHREHWYATEVERNSALKEMSEKYLYFRPGDKPTLKYERIGK